MGSSGSGNFTDYSHASYQETPAGKIGGSSNENSCDKAFACTLEDVENCEFFKSKSILPSVKTEVYIDFQAPRLAAFDSEGVLIGLLPTTYNYILACVRKGYKYLGVVSVSRSKPVSIVQVTITPSK
jgi:hypothetical protein